jgi:hypothetical protein
VKPSHVVLVTIAGIVVVVGLAIGGWQGGWWLRSNAVNRNAHLYQQGYGAQTADLQQMQSLVSEIAGIGVQIADPSTPPSEVPQLRDQQAAEINQACGVANLVTPGTMPASLQQWTAANCG